MKSRILVNSVTIVALTVASLFLAITGANAAIIPTIGGKVVDTNGKAIPNVWVKLTTSGNPGYQCGLSTPAVRYERTDSNGNYRFDPQQWWSPDPNRVGKMIDTNLDGQNDAPQMEDRRSPYCEIELNDVDYQVITGDYGCGAVPFTLTAVKPHNWSGSFSTETISFNNAQANATVTTNNIVYSTNPLSSNNEPEYPSCPNNGKVLEFKEGFAENAQPGWDVVKSKSYTFNANAGTGTVKIYSALGHPWEGCKEGPENDDNRHPCDQIHQTGEQVRVYLNGTELGITDDTGTDITIYKEFTGTLRQGSNTLLVEHAGLKDPKYSGSVTIKASICQGSASSLPQPSSLSPTSIPVPSSSATPSPTPTNNIGCTASGNCSVKKIGYVEGVQQSFEDKSGSSIEKDKTAWVKVSVNGFSGGNNSVQLNERITGSNFRIKPLQPNDTLRIKVQSSLVAPEIDRTNTLCSSGACLSNVSDTQFQIYLGALAPQNIVHVYFAVTPTNATTGSGIPVDAVDGAGNQLSTITYTPIGTGTPRTVTVNNVTVSIDAPSYNFFQAIVGSIFSYSRDAVNSITSILAPGEFLVRNNEPLVVSRGGVNAGSGKISPETNKKIITSYPEYFGFADLEGLEDSYEGKIQTITSSNLSAVNGNEYGYYKIDGDFVVNNTWRGNKIQNKHITIFIEKNLYIEAPIDVDNNGNSAVVFIVKGNVGIDPSVRAIEGIFLTDGVIDTACSREPNGFGADKSCDPATAPDSLQLEGLFYSGQSGGFKLERQGAPGELFIYRPDMVFAASSQIGKITLYWKEAIE